MSQQNGGGGMVNPRDENKKELFRWYIWHHNINQILRNWKSDPCPALDPGPALCFGHFFRLNLCYWPLPGSLALRQTNHLCNLTWQVLCSVMHDVFTDTPGFHLKPNCQGFLIPRLKCWCSCLYALPHLPGAAGWVLDPAQPFFHISMAGKAFLASPQYVVCDGCGAAAVLLRFPVKVSGSLALIPSGLGSLVQLFPCWTSWRCMTKRTPSPLMPGSLFQDGGESNPSSEISLSLQHGDSRLGWTQRAWRSVSCSEAVSFLPVQEMRMEQQSSWRLD